jgi:tetratricopeptide (TPR) repeat protein
VFVDDEQNALNAIQPCFSKPESDADKFVGCYLQRAYIEMNLSNIDAAMADFQKAANFDPQSPIALNDLAACQLLASDFSGARKGFEESNRISPKLLTILNLGETDWYLHDFSDALRLHQFAADNLDGNIAVDDRLVGGEWTEPYFPLQGGDRETIKNWMHVYTVAQKKTTLHFALAIDHALLEDFVSAEKEFATAIKLQPNPAQRRLIQNRMESVERMAQMPNDSRAWLIAHRSELE